MIPNRAMFYWSGGPLSWMRLNTLWSFRKLHPDWEMILFWGGSDRPAPPSGWKETQDFSRDDLSADFLPRVRELGVDVRTWNRPASYPEATPVHCNDLCRWGALSKFGGWFFDLDFLFVDSIPKQLDCGDANCVFVPGRDWIPTGFIGAEKDCDFTATMYSAALAAPDRTRYRAAGSEAIARLIGLKAGDWMQHSTQQLRMALRKVFAGVRWYFPSTQIAYPWEWHDVNLIFGSDEVLKLQCTVAIHWFGGSRAAQRNLGKLAENNYAMAPKCTYTSYVRDLAEAEVIL